MGWDTHDFFVRVAVCGCGSQRMCAAASASRHQRNEKNMQTREGARALTHTHRRCWWQRDRSEGRGRSVTHATISEALSVGRGRTMRRALAPSPVPFVLSTKAFYLCFAQERASHQRIAPYPRSLHCCIYFRHEHPRPSPSPYVCVSVSLSLSLSCRTRHPVRDNSGFDVWVHVCVYIYIYMRAYMCLFAYGCLCM